MLTRRAPWIALALALAAIGATAACSSPETHPPVLGDCKDPAKCNTGGDGGVVVQDASVKDAAGDTGSGTDSAVDAGADSASDAGADSAPDAGADAAADAASDAGADGNG